MSTFAEQLLDLEHAGWRSLCAGTASDFYRSAMTPDGRMVLANGSVMSRAEVVEALRDAPPWASYEIREPLATLIAPDVAVLVYTGIGRREEGAPFTGVMTSLYVRDSTGWKLAHYQQTPVT